MRCYGRPALAGFCAVPTAACVGAVGATVRAVAGFCAVPTAACVGNVGATGVTARAVALALAVLLGRCVADWPG